MSPQSSSQKTFAREAEALAKMPTTPGEAACKGDDRFDIFTEKSTVSKTVRNDLAKVCAGCAITDCGWRLTVER
jgi:hypothetical protein